MIDTVSATGPQPPATTALPAGRPWLLLIHHLPPKPDYLRVKVRRRLTQAGAALVKPSVYALPFSDSAVEDLEWLRREICDLGGEAIICAVELLQGLTDEALVALFVTERQQAYHEIEAEAVQTSRELAAGSADAREAVPTLNRLRRRLLETRAIDFFGAPGRANADVAIAALENQLFPQTATSGGAMPLIPDHGQAWVTRTGVKVDRIASAWLIRRFIDPQAHFVFVDPAEHTHRAGELRFDMYEGEFTHEEDRCTFETLMKVFALEQPGLKAIAEIVHDIDCKETKFDRPERAGIASLIDGIVAAHQRDDARITAGLPLFDALYLSLSGQ